MKLFNVIKNGLSAVASKISNTASAVATALLVGLGLGAGSTPAQAAVDTAMSGVVTDTATFWTSIQAVVLGVIVFGIAATFLAKLRGKRG